MASIRKRGNYWQAQVRRKGWPPQSGTFDTKREAQAWAADIEAAMARGTFTDRTEVQNTTLGELLQRYKSEMTPKKEGSDVESYRINAFLRHPLASRFLSSIRSIDIATYRDERLEKVGNGTVTRELNLLSHVFATARREWSIPVENPCSHVSRPKQPQGRSRRLRKDEEEYLRAACRSSRTHWLEPLVTLAIETAMRRSDLLRLNWSDIDHNSRVATIQKSKNGEGRSVPLSPTAIDALRKLPRRIDGSVIGVTANAVKKSWQRALGRARRAYQQQCARNGTAVQHELFHDLHFHDLRHEATSRLFEVGLNVMEVASITGHKDLRMLRRYTHLDAAALAIRLAKHHQESANAMATN